MNQEKRLKILLKALNDKKEMTYQEVMDLLNVSRDTARRDIVKLVEEKLAVRSYGGVLSLDYKDDVLDFRKRMQVFPVEKEEIAKRATTELVAEKVIFLDVSTIVLSMCKQIGEKMTVYTHSLDNASVLGEKEMVDLNIFGGKLMGNNRFLYEEETVEKINNMYFDQAFIGCAAISKDGIYFEDGEDAKIITAVLKRSRQVYLLAEHQKFYKHSTYKGGDLSDIHILITNQILNDEEKQIFPHDIQIIETGGFKNE